MENAIVAKLLSPLDDAQKSVARHVNGPAVVIAGPGAGKTACLIHRLGVMVANGIDPSSILATTFTKNAAVEMNKRADKTFLDCGFEGIRPTISTFHSFGYSVLKSHGWNGYSVIKRKKMMIIDILKEMRLSTEEWLPEEIILDIAHAKNALLTPDMLRAELRKNGEDTRTADIYARYEEAKKAEKVLDFEDMLFYAFYLLKGQPDILREYRARYHYVMVDECQDNNIAQLELAMLLTDGGHGNLMMIGDDCQAIYGFRGAAPRIMLEFAERPDVTKLYLTRNYRSVGVVVTAANRMIENNSERLPKELFTKREDGATPVLGSFIDSHSEAEWIAEQIGTAIATGTPMKEIAVIYRTNAQSRAIEDALRRKSIPATIIGGTPFYGRAEIMDLCAYLKLMDGDDEESFGRVYMNPPRYLGKAWFNEFKARGATLSALNRGYSKSYMDRGARALADDIAMLRSMKGSTPAEVVEAILDLTGAVHSDKTLRDLYGRPEEGGDTGDGVVSDRQENCDEFLNLAGEHGTLAEFKDFLAKAQEGASSNKDDQLGADTVKLMSIHKAKGLEFVRVFVAGCSEGLLPHRRAIQDGGLEEERRLMYVAITRAKDLVTCSHVQTRFGRALLPSRFLSEAFEPEVLGQLHAAMADSEAPEGEQLAKVIALADRTDLN